MAMKFSNAICRKVPKSLVTGAQRIDDGHEPISYERACEQHEEYLKTLKSLGLDVILLEADEKYPDCVFVEDTAVVCEEVVMKKALEDLAIQVTVMKEPAKMDGGDVLFTGKEFFVGLSRRTNKGGLEAFKKVFPDYPVHGIEILEGSLHIKSVMTLVGDDAIAVGNSKAAQHALQEMKSKMKVQYNFLQVPHDAMANSLFINDHVIHS